MLETFRKLRDLLNARERRNAVLIFCMMVLLGLLEGVGVTSIMPFISVLANPEIVQTNKYLAELYRWLGCTNTNQFLLFLAAMVFVVTTGRVVFAAITQYAIVRFYNMRNLALSMRLLERYLRQPYVWFLDRHSSDLGRTVLSEVDHVINGSLKPGLDLIAHTVVSLCFIAVLIIVDPVIAITALLILGGAYGAVYLGVQKYLGRIGRDRFSANRERFQIAQDILSGIKEVKVSGTESACLSRFRGPASRFYRRKSTSHIINQLPRYFFEAITIGGMLVVVMALLVRSGGDLSKVLPMVALYAFTGMRLMPILQQIYSDLTRIRFGRTALNTLHADLAGGAASVNASAHEARTPLPLRNSIFLRDVSFSYPNAVHPVLADLTLSIPARTTVGFVGTTGAGKTTIIDLILGLLEPSKGEVRIDGTTITKDNIRAWQRAVGYVPQNIFLADETVAGNIAFGVPPHEIDQQAVERAARFAELHRFVSEELPHGYETTVGERGLRLSGGQRQRIGIARALYHDPDVIVLDEATSALDTVTERAIMDALHNLAEIKTIILIAHRLSTLRACHKIFFLKQGRIKAAGTYDDLSAGDADFREMALIAA